MADRVGSFTGASEQNGLRARIWRRSAADVAVDVIAGAFALLPLWWVLGLEQVIWAAAAVVAAVVLASSRRRMRIPVPVWVLAAALVPIVASLATIESPDRLVTYLRSVVGYLTFGAIALIASNVADRPSRTHRLVVGLGIGMACDVALGGLAALGILRPTFAGPVMDAVLPAGLTATDLGQRFVTRSLGTESWFSLYGTYFRVNGLFLFATMHAAALAVTLPFLAYLARRAAGLARVLWIAAVGLALANLALTTGRSAILATMLGFALFLLRRSRSKLLVAIATTAIGLGAITLWAVVPGGAVADPVREVLAARGSSTSDRLRIYDATLREIARQPWIGFGTERDREDLPYPVGSHSFVLGLAYRHGVIALLLALLAGYGIWRSARRQAKMGMSRSFARYLEWSLMAILVVSLTDVTELDATTFALTAVVAGFALARAPLEPLDRGGTTMGPSALPDRDIP